MRRPTSSILVLAVALPMPALAYEDAPTPDPDQSSPTPGDRSAASRPFAPPPIDYPGVQSLGPGTSLYLDATYETSSDLSTFDWVRGHGTSYRVALGGTFQWGGLRLNAELPVQYTELTIDSLNDLPPTDADRRKVSISLADVVTRAAYFWELPWGGLPTHAGLGLRVRWPTHTTRYQFGLVTGGILEFGFPYYVHLAPAVLLSASYGRLHLLLNEGVLAMLAKDISLDGVIQPIPDLYFWESHLVVGVDAAEWLLLSVELESFVQLNHVEVTRMTALNDTRAVFVNPGVTVALGDYRVALAGRLGVSGRSARDFGVITFSGTHAVLARVSYVF
jgi:hypothetical protein